MSDTFIDPAGWAGRALHHARHIATALPGRGSATPSEVEAAGYVREQFDLLGIPAVQLQKFRGLRSIWVFLALVFGLALAGHAAYWLLVKPIGLSAALCVSILAFAFSAYLFWRKFTFRSYPLQGLLPHGPSQNLIAILPPSDSKPNPRRVVLLGHLDSHRAVLWFATDWLVRLYDLLTPLTVFGLAVSPILYTLAALSRQPFFAWLAIPLALLHFLGWFTGLTADLGQYSPGANDNASAVGTLLALAERLGKEPLSRTETWLAFTGCEETGCDGMLALLREHGQALKEAVFIDFELVGIGGELVYLHGEGLLRKREISADIERLVCKAGEKFALKPVRAAGHGVFTEIGTAWEHGFQGVCLMARRHGSPLMPEWHRMSDTPDRLEAGALGNVHELAWELLKQIDAA